MFSKAAQLLFRKSRWIFNCFLWFLDFLFSKICKFFKVFSFACYLQPFVLLLFFFSSIHLSNNRYTWSLNIFQILAFFSLHLQLSTFAVIFSKFSIKQSMILIIKQGCLYKIFDQSFDNDCFVDTIFD